MAEQRFKAKTADQVPPPTQFACSYQQAREALEAVCYADNDTYSMSDAPVYALRAGTVETKATDLGLFVIHCEQRVRDGSEWQISAGEVYWTSPEKRIAVIRESFAPFPVKSA